MQMAIKAAAASLLESLNKLRLNKLYLVTLLPIMNKQAMSVSDQAKMWTSTTLVVVPHPADA